MLGDALTPLAAATDISTIRPAFANAVGVTNFGDQALVLPLAAAIALVFALSGWRRGALAWTSAIGGTLAVILLLKLYFFACHVSREAGFGNPSGHTAAAAAVYGGLAATIMRSVRDDRRWALVCAATVGVFLAAVIGMTRLILDMHSMAEVVAGGAIGVGGAVSFVLLAGAPARVVRIERVIAAGLLVTVMLYGYRLSAEPAIKSIAASLSQLSQCM
jgi:membrane-associated phospholipid phosphatase